MNNPVTLDHNQLLVVEGVLRDIGCVKVGSEYLIDKLSGDPMYSATFINGNRKIHILETSPGHKYEIWGVDE